MGKIIEGLWDCPFCGNKRIRAGQKTCPDCGHPQDENTKFYMPDEIKYQVIAKLAVLVRNLEPKQGRIREEHDLWNEKWIIAHVRRTLISYGLYESGKS